MFKRLGFCLAVPSILSAATVAFGAEPSPLDYTLEYQLADGGEHVVESGRVILLRRNPNQLRSRELRLLVPPRYSHCH